MLTEIRIENFKAWLDTGAVRLAPLTIIFGANSSGKSSLGHFLLALKQTAQMVDRKRAFHLGDENSLVDIGTFSDCIHGHDLRRSLKFDLRWRSRGLSSFKDSLSGESYSFDEVRLSAEIGSDRLRQPETRSFSYALYNDDEEALNVFHSKERGTRDGKLTCFPISLVRAPGRKWPADPPEKFYRFSDKTLLRYQNADFLANFALEAETALDGIYYLGPLRHPPKRVYQWAGETPPDVGKQGEYSIAALLAAKYQKRLLNRGFKKKRQFFDVLIAELLVYLGILYNFRVAPVAKGRKEYEVLVRSHVRAPEVKLTDVGFGVSQVLPTLVQAFYAPTGSTVWMEQPELHLHPKAQSNLADVFIDAINAYEDGRPRNVQLIIETHSEHFLTRLQRRVAEGEIEADKVAAYFVKNTRGKAEIVALKLDSNGEILNWPDNFFGDEMEDIAARALAVISKKE